MCVCVFFFFLPLHTLPAEFLLFFLLVCCLQRSRVEVHENSDIYIYIYLDITNMQIQNFKVVQKKERFPFFLQRVQRLCKATRESLYSKSDLGFKRRKKRMFFRKARHVHFLYKHTYSHVDAKRTQLYAWKTYISSFCCCCRKKRKKKKRTQIHEQKMRWINSKKKTDIASQKYTYKYK